VDLPAWQGTAGTQLACASAIRAFYSSPADECFFAEHGGLLEITAANDANVGTTIVLARYD